MTPPLLRATRVRKARSNAACGLCGAPVSIGTQIGRIEDEGRAWWAHLSCIRARREAAERARKEP